MTIGSANGRRNAFLHSHEDLLGLGNQLFLVHIHDKQAVVHIDSIELIRDSAKQALIDTRSFMNITKDDNLYYCYLGILFEVYKRSKELITKLKDVEYKGYEEVYVRHYEKFWALGTKLIN